tara:strand:- start:645 stop:2780 length:2136 start_codon:yes stop_codon:yes gene_type:complete
MNKEISNYIKKSDQINLGRLLRLILLQSKLIFGLTLLGLIIGISIFLISDKTYKISSLLQVYSPNQQFDPRQSLNIDFFNAPETNLENLVTLYSSRTNMLGLVKGLNLNLKLQDLEEKENLSIKTFVLKKNEKNHQNSFLLEILQGDFFNLLDDEKNFILMGENGKKIKNDNFEIHLNFSNLNPGKLIKISYLNPSDLYNLYKRKLKVKSLGNTSSYWSQEGLLEVSLLAKDVNQGKLILNSANEIFIEDSIKVETEKARTSILFIDSQLESLEKILNLRKNELQSFKQENKSLNVNLEVESIISLIADVEKEINKVDLELSQAEINFTKDNPLYLNLKTQRNALDIQRLNIEQKIENLPVAQQEYIDLFRNLEVTEDLYSELVNRKLNFSIEEASSIGNIRIVDRAFVENLVSPKLSTTFLITMFFFIIGILVAIFRGIFFISISNPAELKDAGLEQNIIGVIPNIDDVEKSEEDIKLEQAIETSILNIETIVNSIPEIDSKKDCKKILFTSPTAENGKSFISKNISEVLARIGHRVLLIDADLKRGTQHKLFSKEAIKLETFENLSLKNIESLKVKDNLYVLPRLKKLKNTFEHLYGNSFLNKVTEFEDFFDYIIIDTAPALSVSDTGLLMTSSDLNFLIIRHQVSRINEIVQTMQIIDQIGRSFDGFIYNDYQKPKGYYGYYDLYGDYSYRYYAERYLYENYYVENDD